MNKQPILLRGMGRMQVLAKHTARMIDLNFTQISTTLVADVNFLHFCVQVWEMVRSCIQGRSRCGWSNILMEYT